MTSSSKWPPSLMSPHQDPVCSPPLPHTCHVTTHLILLNLIKLTIYGEAHRSWSSLLCSFLHSPVTSQSHTSSSTPYCWTPPDYVPLIMWDQVSHPYKTTGKIIVNRNNSIFNTAVFLHVMPGNWVEVDWRYRGLEYGDSRFLQNIIYAPTNLLPYLKKEAASPSETWYASSSGVMVQHISLHHTSYLM